MISLLINSTNYNRTPAFGFKTSTTPIGPIKKIGDSDYPDEIKIAAKRVAHIKEPVGELFTREGFLLLTTKGDEHHPIIKNSKNYNDFMALTKANLGFIFLHNHPKLDEDKTPKPVGMADLQAIAIKKGSEVIAVHPDETYSTVKCLDKEKYFSSETIRRLNRLYERMPADAKKKINTSGAFTSSGKEMDKWWRKNAKYLGVNYYCSYSFGN